MCGALCDLRAAPVGGNRHDIWGGGGGNGDDGQRPLVPRGDAGLTQTPFPGTVAWASEFSGGGASGLTGLRTRHPSPSSLFFDRWWGVEPRNLVTPAKRQGGFLPSSLGFIARALHTVPMQCAHSASAMPYVSVDTWDCIRTCCVVSQPQSE